MLKGDKWKPEMMRREVGGSGWRRPKGPARPGGEPGFRWPQPGPGKRAGPAGRGDGPETHQPSGGGETPTWGDSPVSPSPRDEVKGQGTCPLSS